MASLRGGEASWGGGGLNNNIPDCIQISCNVKCAAVGTDLKNGSCARGSLTCVENSCQGALRHSTRNIPYLMPPTSTHTAPPKLPNSILVQLRSPLVTCDQRTRTPAPCPLCIHPPPGEPWPGIPHASACRRMGTRPTCGWLPCCTPRTSSQSEPPPPPLPGRRLWAWPLPCCPFRRRRFRKPGLLRPAVALPRAPHRLSVPAVRLCMRCPLRLLLVERRAPAQATLPRACPATWLPVPSPQQEPLPQSLPGTPGHTAGLGRPRDCSAPRPPCRHQSCRRRSRCSRARRRAPYHLVDHPPAMDPPLPPPGGPQRQNLLLPPLRTLPRR